RCAKGVITQRARGGVQLLKRMKGEGERREQDQQVRKQSERELGTYGHETFPRGGGAMHEGRAICRRATVDRTGGVGSTRNPLIFSIIVAQGPLRQAPPPR
ncbi:MAG: hypothetical protein ABI884_05170, partial [Gemmatimonadota bacterium]